MPPEELRRISEEIHAAYRPVEDSLALRLMPIDPGRAHAYWNIPLQAVEGVRRGMGDATAVLRVWGEDESGVRSHIDLPISLAPRNWYFDVRFAPGRPVFAEIGLRAPDGAFRPLVRSDPVYLPNAAPGRSAAVLYMRLTKDGGVEYVEPPPPAGPEVRTVPAAAGGAGGVSGAAGGEARGTAEAAREEAARRLAAAAIDDGERKRIVAMMDRGIAIRWDGDAGGETRRLAAEAEKARRDWPAWLRSLTEEEIGIFYERLRAPGGTPGSSAAPGGGDPAGAVASVRQAIERFLEAARAAGVPFRPGLAERIARLAEAAARGDEAARRALLELTGRTETYGDAPWRMYSSGP